MLKKSARRARRTHTSSRQDRPVGPGARLLGMSRTAAQKLVNDAHEVCPYSNATRGNIDVVLTVV